MTTIREAYVPVESAWPAKVPAMTGPEAVRAARRLFRFGTGTTFTGKVFVSTGNRYNDIRWPRNGSTLSIYVNPSRGWKHFVHELSHDLVYYANSGAERGHSKFHARFEAKCVREVLRRGWLDGRLRVEAPAPPTLDDKRRAKLASIDARLKSWESKRLRAERALSKLTKSRRYYAQALREE